MNWNLSRPRVKICCIKSIEEAFMAIHAGADALGLVGHMPSGPGVINDEAIKQITANIPPAISTFLLTSETQAKDIIEHHKITQTSTLQLVDYVDPSTYETIRKALPMVKIVQVIHVLDETDVQRSMEIAPLVDGLLLDSGNPNLKVKQLGGTGNTHDWSISRKIQESVNKAVFLAGGLNASNVKTAIQAVQPYGLDLCSGVRTNGNLDPNKLNQFIQATY